jgi:hypothetical protein
MKWSDIPKNPPPRTLRQFAAAWLVFLLAFGAHQHLARAHHGLALAAVIAAVGLGGLGLFKPAAVRWLFIGCLVVTFPIGWMVSQVMLLLMFYGIITPVAAFFRLRGRDLLALKPRPDRATWWVPKPTPQNVRSYFRQY